MKRFITYLIVMAATIYIAILYGSASFLMLFYAEIFLPVVLFFASVPQIRGIRVQLRLPIPVVERGQRTTVELLLQNKAVLPSGRVAVQVTCHFPMNRKPQKTWFYGRISGGSRLSPALGRLRAEYQADCVGNVKMEITRVKCYDLIGLVALPLPKRYWKQLEPETLLVLPKISEVPVFVSRQSRDFAGESEEYSKDRGGDDPSETFQIRDYQPGDKLRSIHWKLSVKADELMVCEHSLPLGCPVVFYLNLHQPLRKRHWNVPRKRARMSAMEKGTSMNKRMPLNKDTPLKKKKLPKKDKWVRGKAVNRDYYLQIAASVSRAMAQEGCRHYIAWYDTSLGDIQRCRVEKEEDVYEMLLELGKMSMYQDRLDLEELYQQKFHESPPITSLELHMDLSLQRNGSSFVTYSQKEEKLERQLGETEILV